MRKPDLLDCRILALVYNRKDWNSELWFTEDLLRLIKIQKPTLLYHMKKLVEEGYLKEMRTYPKAWQATSKEAFQRADKQVAFALKYLLKKDELL